MRVFYPLPSLVRSFDYGFRLIAIVSLAQCETVAADDDDGPAWLRTRAPD